jgi:hypothetical protein
VEPNFESAAFAINDSLLNVLSHIFRAPVPTHYLALVKLLAFIFFGKKDVCSIPDFRILTNVKTYFTKLLSLFPKNVFDGKQRMVFCRILTLLCRNLFEVIPALLKSPSECSLVVLPRELMGSDEPQHGWIVVATAKSKKEWAHYEFCAGIVPAGTSDVNFEVHFDFKSSPELVTCVVVRDAQKQSSYSLLSLLFMCFPNFGNARIDNDQTKHLVSARLLNALASDDNLCSEFNSEVYTLIKNDKHNALEGDDREFYQLLRSWLIAAPTVPNSSLKLKSSLCETIAGDKDAIEVASMSLSPTLLIRILQTLLKLYLRIFVILQGNTGIGKTRSITLIRSLLRLSNSGWIDCVIDFHGGVTQADVRRQLTFSEGERSSVLIFLDEVNTSPAGGYALTLALVKSFSDCRFAFVAAINQVEEMAPVAQQLIRCGIPQKLQQQVSGIRLCEERGQANSSGRLNWVDRSKFAYNALGCPTPVKSFIITVEPSSQPSGGSVESKFFVPDEQQIIGSQIHFSLLAWISGGKCNVQQDELPPLRLIQPIKTILCAYLCQGFRTVRTFTTMRPILSFRDVVRVTELFKWVFVCLSRHFPQSPAPESTRGRVTRQSGSNALVSSLIDQTARAIVISVFLGFFLRFSAKLIVKDAQKFVKERKDELRRLLHRLDDKHFKNNNSEIYFRRIVMDAVCSVTKTFRNNKVGSQISQSFPDAGAWEREVVKFGFWKCYKYVQSSMIAKLPVLLYHLLLVKGAAYAFRHDSESSAMSVLLIGGPGMSKSLAANLFADYYTGRSTSEHDTLSVHMSQYLCSRSSEADGLIDQFRDAAEIVLKGRAEKKKMRVCVLLDEIGLGNLNRTNPLKVMHAIQDKGVEIIPTSGQVNSEFVRLLIVETSNYALDFAIQNRGFLHCSHVPNDSEFEHYCALEPEDATQPRHPLSDLKDYLGLSIPRKKRLPYLDINVQRALDDLVPVRLAPTGTSSPLSKLWHEFGDRRPEVIPMRALYAYIQAFRELPTFQKFYVLINAFQTAIDCHGNSSKLVEREADLFRIASELYKQIPGNSMNEAGNAISFLIDEIASHQSFSDPAKSILIRTQSYEAAEILLTIVTSHGQGQFHHLFPGDDRNPDDDTTDRAFDTLLRVILASPTELHWFVVTGNASIADYSLDLLNIEHPENDKWSPVLVCRGYPIRLLTYPTLIRFIFILNDNDLRSDHENPVPIPLLDRLMHFTIDRSIYQAQKNDLPKDSWADELEELDTNGNTFAPLAESDFTLVQRYLVESESDTCDSDPPVRPSFQQQFTGFFDWITSNPTAADQPDFRSQLWRGSGEIPRVIVLTATSPMMHSTEQQHGHLRIIEIPDIRVRDADSLRAILNEEAAGCDAQSVVLVIRSSLFMIEGSDPRLEADRRYRFLLDELMDDVLKLIVIVYSRSTHTPIAGLSSFSRWPVIWIQEWIPSPMSIVPLNMIAIALHSTSFNVSANQHLFGPLVEQAVNEIHLSLFKKIVQRPRAIHQRVTPRQGKPTTPTPVSTDVSILGRRLQEWVVGKLAPPASGYNIEGKLAHLRQEVIRDILTVDLRGSFFAIVSEGVISESFRFGLGMVLVRLNGALARLSPSEFPTNWLETVFSFVRNHQPLLPSLAILCSAQIDALAQDLRPFELFQPIVKDYIAGLNADSIYKYKGYLNDLNTFLRVQDRHTWDGFKDICSRAMLFEEQCQSVVDGIVPNQNDSVWSIIDELLCYRGAAVLGYPSHVAENERYREDPPDQLMLSNFDENDPFKLTQMQQVVKNDFTWGNVVGATKKSSGVHPWVLARAFRSVGVNGFQIFYGTTDGAMTLVALARSDCSCPTPFFQVFSSMRTSIGSTLSQS